MVNTETTTSKRGALRFSGYDRRLTYKTNYEDGEARILNISTSGCAISGNTTSLDLNEKVLLSLPLDKPDELVQIRAKVIRVDADNFGLQFIHLEDATKQRLIHFFAKENRRRKSQMASET